MTAYVTLVNASRRCPVCRKYLRDGEPHGFDECQDWIAEMYWDARGADGPADAEDDS